MKKQTYIAVLSIAGSDSGGGAGIQADVKTFSALGCYGTTAITAITVQNTLGVTAIHSIPPEIVAGQIRAVMEDIRPRAVKIGMIHQAALVCEIAEVLSEYPHVPVVLDPVMVATSGDKLIQEDTVAAIREKLFPLATLVTPNLDEASLLAEMPITDLGGMERAARKILEGNSDAVLVKGGHLQGETLHDVYLDRSGAVELITSKYIDTPNTHGTGCTLSAAIACFLARGNELKTAVRLASDYIHGAIGAGSSVSTGSGHGPLNHFFNPEKLIIDEVE